MSDKRIKMLAYGGVLTALVAVFTMFIQLPVPITSGYVHLGDGVIFAAAAFMGPYATIVGAVGSALADLLAGYAHYALITFVIKGLMGLVAGLLLSRTLKKSQGGKSVSIWMQAFAFALCEVIMVAGYFAFESATIGVEAAMGAVLPNIVQGVAGVIMGCIFAPLILRLKRQESQNG